MWSAICDSEIMRTTVIPVKIGPRQYVFSAMSAQHSRLGVVVFSRVRTLELTINMHCQCDLHPQCPNRLSRVETRRLLVIGLHSHVGLFAAVFPRKSKSSTHHENPTVLLSEVVYCAERHMISGGLMSKEA